MSENFQSKTFKLPTSAITVETQRNIHSVIHSALTKGFNVDMTRSLFIVPFPNTVINHWLSKRITDGDKTPLVFDKLITQTGETLYKTFLNISGNTLTITTNRGKENENTN